MTNLAPCGEPSHASRERAGRQNMNTPPLITQHEMSEEDIEFAERMAARLGYLQTAYTSTSQLWGLYCLPDHARHRKGCIIKTLELGFIFVADLEDLNLHAMKPAA